MTSVAFALLFASAIGLTFKTTRGIGIASSSLFCLLFPKSALILIFVAAVALLIYYYHFR